MDEFFAASFLIREKDWQPSSSCVVHVKNVMSIRKVSAVCVPLQHWRGLMIEKYSTFLGSLQHYTSFKRIMHPCDFRNKCLPHDHDPCHLIVRSIVSAFVCTLPTKKSLPRKQGSSIYFQNQQDP